jgi:hypothetical protein
LSFRRSGISWRVRLLRRWTLFTAALVLLPAALATS